MGRALIGPTVVALVAILTLTLPVHAADPVVSNVRAAQREGTKLVDIHYDVADADSATLSVTVSVSVDGGATWGLSATHFSGDGYGTSVTPDADRAIVWDAAADWNGEYSTQVKFRVTASDGTDSGAAPEGMVLIPGGSFAMGDSFEEGSSGELPVHAVHVSSFYVGKYEVTKALWDEAYSWAVANGYSFDNAGSGKGAQHPVYSVNWYSMVKWCNARSEREGLTPCYYTSSGKTTVYRTGRRDLQNGSVRWDADGYRLPTEAEWEKAARGGLAGERFPWGDAHISHDLANYCSYWHDGQPYHDYDAATTEGYHPDYDDGGMSYTSAVASFPYTGYGLYDMAGNLHEWCWDWYGSYTSASQTDPLGSASGSRRVIRGGSWSYGADGCRCAYRESRLPGDSALGVGFRLVRNAARGSE